MREIKFRAWCGHRMHYNIGLGYPAKDELGVLTMGDVMWQPATKFKIMQLTNLKDKNDKEIYEGDVLVIENSKYPPPKNRLGVEWDEQGGWSPFIDKDCGSMLDGGGEDPKECEVIGNIYENPELLK